MDCAVWPQPPASGQPVLYTVVIPLIVISLAAGVVSIVVPDLRWIALWLFVGGWALQFVGHAVEGKPPEFFHDWRFLLVGLRWWVAKMRGRV
jgi:uncharacterized membrane protein YGL010W